MFFDDNLINYIIFIFIFIKIIVLKYNYSCKLIRLFKLIKYVLIYVVCKCILNLNYLMDNK